MNTMTATSASQPASQPARASRLAFLLHVLRQSASAPALCLAALLALAAFSAPCLRADTTVITEDTGIENTNAGSFILNSGPTIFEIADGAVLSFVRPGAASTTAGGMYNITTTGGTTAGPSALFKIGPSTPGGTGMALFEGISTTGQGDVFFTDGRNGGTVTVDITNAIFRGNHTTSNVSGVIHVQDVRVTATFTNVLFDGNYSMSTGITGGAGVMRSNGALTVNSSTFLGNYAVLGSSGVMDMNNNNTANQSFFTDVMFDSNRAAQTAGVMRFISNNPNSSRVSATNSVFVNNWAGGQGGVIYNTSNGSSNPGFFFYMTAAGGTVYNFAGNGAGYAASGVATQAEVITNTPLGAAQAKAGGFLFASEASRLNASNRAQNRAVFNIDPGVTLNIGAASATDKALDSFATDTFNVNLITNARLEKSGGDDLVLNANNSY
jgi:hypothetical protein